jgi:hypothetical protein
LSAQKERYLQAGFDFANAIDMYELWRRLTSEESKRLCDGIERLDEVEEWELISRHYCVVWAVKGKDISERMLNIQAL